MAETLCVVDFDTTGSRATGLCHVSVPRMSFLFPAPGLVCHPGPDHPVLVDPEDTLQASPLRRRLHLSAGHGGHGGGRPAGWKRPGLQ